MTILEFETPEQAEAILHLLQQGIEVERLRLQVQQLTKSHTMESYLMILHGEKVTSLLIASGVS